MVGARQRVLQLPVVLIIVAIVVAAAVTGVVTASAATAAMLLSLPHGPRISLLPFVESGWFFGCPCAGLARRAGYAEHADAPMVAGPTVTSGYVFRGYLTANCRPAMKIDSAPRG